MFYATAVVPALGQSTLIFQHSGATDPLTEGFDKALAPGNGYPVINDMGANAWVTPGISNLNVFYSYVLTPQQQAESAGAGWTLSADLRITTTNSYPVFSLLLDGYGAGYGLDFGSDPNGEQFVDYLGGSAALGGRVTLAGSNYNNYQIRYDPSADTLSLWINGEEYASNFSTNRAAYLVEVGWGSGYYGAQNAQANWNLVSLEITPEPSAMALFGLGALIVAARRLHGRH